MLRRATGLLYGEKRGYIFHSFGPFLAYTHTHTHSQAGPSSIVHHLARALRTVRQIFNEFFFHQHRHRLRGGHKKTYIENIICDDEKKGNGKKNNKTSCWGLGARVMFVFAGRWAGPLCALEH